MPSTRAGDVKEVALDSIDLMQISVVSDRSNALLQEDDFVV